jgi:hypothetical protein
LVAANDAGVVERLRRGDHEEVADARIVIHQKGASTRCVIESDQAPAADPGISPRLTWKEHPQTTVRVDPKHRHIAINAGTRVHPHAVPATVRILAVGPDADPRFFCMTPQRVARRGRAM